MKRPSLLKAFIAVVVFFTGCAFSDAQINDLFLSSFIKDEATFLAQEIQIPRSSSDNPVTLRTQLKSVIGDLNYTDAVIVQSYMGGNIEVQKCDDVNALLDMDPIFLSFDKGEGQLDRKQFEINTSVYLNFTNANGIKRCCVVHLRPRGFLDTVIYTRTTLMLPSDNTDDLRSFRSKSSALSLSYLTVYDVRDLTKEREEFQRIYKSAVDKYNNDQELNENESNCIKGLRERNDLGGYIGYGNWLYDASRYYDANINYLPAFEVLKNYIRPGVTDFNDIFYSMCHKIGVGMWKMGYHDSADYYLGLASYGSPDAKNDYAQFLQNKLSDVEEFTGPGVYLGQVLPILFDIDKNCVMQAVSNIDGSISHIGTRDEVWNYDLKSLCTGSPGHITISYTRAKSEKDATESSDKSILCYDNNIIFSTVQIDESMWRVNVVIPNFRNFDEKRTDDEFSRPLSASFVISNKPLKQCSIKANASYESVRDQFDNTLEIFGEYRYMETLIATLPFYKYMTTLGNKVNKYDKWRQLYGGVLYQVGYCYSELEQPVKAVPYLSKAYSLVDETVVSKEYVTILSNIVDPRAFGVIKQALAKNPEDKQYRSLLNRRYAYMLIEYGMLDEAEAVLKTLLQDPDSKKFAEGELKYVEHLKKNR